MNEQIITQQIIRVAGMILVFFSVALLIDSTYSQFNLMMVIVSIILWIIGWFVYDINTKVIKGYNLK